MHVDIQLNDGVVLWYECRDNVQLLSVTWILHHRIKIRPRHYISELQAPVHAGTVWYLGIYPWLIAMN